SDVCSSDLYVRRHDIDAVMAPNVLPSTQMIQDNEWPQVSVAPGHRLSRCGTPRPAPAADPDHGRQRRGIGAVSGSSPGCHAGLLDRIGLRRPISCKTGMTIASNPAGPYLRRMARSTPLPLASSTRSLRTR